jgi:uncharacterized protein
VLVTVTEVDAPRKRIALTMKTDQPENKTNPKPMKPEYQKEVKGMVPENDMQSRLAALKSKFK